jgi:hypothetical protein
MLAADAPPLWLPPPLALAKPANIRPAEHALLKPGAFRPMTREERRATIADLVRTKRLTAAEAARAMFFVPAVMWSSTQAPPIVVNSAVSSSASTSSFVVNLPASLVSGNLLLMGVVTQGGAVTTPSGWTLLNSVSSASPYYYLFRKTSTGSEGSTVTVTIAGAGCGAVVYQISGWSGTPAVGTAASGSGTTPDPPSVTASSSPFLSVSFAAGRYSSGTQSITSVPSGYSNGIIGALASSGVVAAVFAAKGVAAGTTENPGTFTLGLTSSTWRTQTVAIAAA